MNAPSLRIETVQHNDITVFRPIGWVGHDNHHVLDERLMALVDKGQRRIVVDLSMVHLVSSTGMGVFLFYRQALEEKGGCLILAAPSAEVWKMLSAAGLTRALEICTTVKEALSRAGRHVDSGRLEPIKS